MKGLSTWKSSHKTTHFPSLHLTAEEMQHQTGAGASLGQHDGASWQSLLCMSSCINAFSPSGFIYSASPLARHLYSNYLPVVCLLFACSWLRFTTPCLKLLGQVMFWNWGVFLTWDRWYDSYRVYDINKPWGAEASSNKPLTTMIKTINVMTSFFFLIHSVLFLRSI